MSRPIGILEILRQRLYETAEGEVAVEPGAYPLVVAESGRVSVQFTGRRSRRVEAHSEPVPDSDLFVLTPAHDELFGGPVQFSHGNWSPYELAELRDDPVATEGHPHQRLRFRFDVAVPS